MTVNPELMTIGEKLRFYREACALSQEQVAKALNVHRSTYTYYENGKTQPSLNTVAKLAAIFNISPLELLPPPDEEELEALRVKDDLRADSPIYQLSKQERGLIAQFRVLSKRDKARALELIGNLSKKDRDSVLK